MFEVCHWLNEPETALVEPGRLRVITDRHSDFWCAPHDESRLGGHFFGARVTSGFTAQLRVSAQCKNHGDFAGLMVQVDDRQWLRAGLGFRDDQPRLDSILTLGCSDLALGSPTDGLDALWVRLTLSRGALAVQVSGDGQSWTLLRLAGFPQAAEYRVGPVCGTPERAGMQVAFDTFTLQPPLPPAQSGLA